MANSKQITIIEEKVNSLVDLLDSLYKENQTLKRSLHDAESRLAQVSQGQSKSSDQKAGTSAAQSSAAREMKAKVNHLIQEVDRCIALLSDQKNG